MRYLKVRWLHEDPETPVLLFSELDEESWEVRKVEVFADGSADFADGNSETARTFLSLEPLPSIEEIARDQQFLPEIIGHAEFERAWEAATGVLHPT